MLRSARKKTSQMIIMEKLSGRAVVKENGSDKCIFKREE